MQNELESIRVGYETLKLSPEEIASDRGLTIEAVKSALINCSSKYRRDFSHAEPNDDKLNFTNEQLAAVNEEIFRTAIYGEDENVRLKAAMYVRDDKKGRRELRQVLGGNTFNLFAFNQSMRAIRESAEKAKMLVAQSEAVEV